MIIRLLLVDIMLREMEQITALLLTKNNKW